MSALRNAPPLRSSRQVLDEDYYRYINCIITDRYLIAQHKILQNHKTIPYINIGTENDGYAPDSESESDDSCDFDNYHDDVIRYKCMSNINNYFLNDAEFTFSTWRDCYSKIMGIINKISVFCNTCREECSEYSEYCLDNHLII